MGVFLTGRADRLNAIKKLIARDAKLLTEGLPNGTIINAREEWPIKLLNSESLSYVDRRAWLKQSLNAFVNGLRPRLRQWWEESSAQ